MMEIALWPCIQIQLPARGGSFSSPQNPLTKRTKVAMGVAGGVMTPAEATDQDEEAGDVFVEGLEQREFAIFDFASSARASYCRVGNGSGTQNAARRTRG
jgi:hypothetical protein